MKSIILARVSEDNQDTKQQMVRLIEYRDRNKNLEKWLEREFDESSTRDKREKFEEVISEIKKSKEPVALITDTIDRLQRGFKESPMLDELRKSGKIELHFIREGLVLHKDSNSADLLRWDMGVMFARSYVLQLSDNVKRKINLKLQSGEWCGKAPIGYLNVDLENDSKDVQPDPLRAPIIRKIFEWYSTGNYSYSGIMQLATEAGLRNNTSAARPLSKSQVEDIIKNPFYYGKMMVKEKLYDHKYARLIDKPLYDKCQEVRLGRLGTKFKYRSKPFIFRGLIKCGYCGCMIGSDIKKDRYVYMDCSHYHGKCGQKRIREEVVLDQIYQAFNAIKIPKDVVENIKGQLKQNFENEQKFNRDSISSLRAEYDRISKRIEVMYEDRLAGRITTDEYDRKVEIEKSKQADIDLQLGDHTQADKEFLITSSYLLDLASRANELFKVSKVEQKRQLINFTLSNLVLKGEKLLWEYKKPFDSMVLCKNSQLWLPRLDSKKRGVGRTFGLPQRRLFRTVGSERDRRAIE